jgi:hypothetical protein
VVDPRREALSALPSTTARVLAFIGVIIGGIAGGLIGFGFIAVQTDSDLWAAVGAMVGALGCAVGSSVLAILVLRAMGEWRQMSDR